MSAVVLKAIAVTAELTRTEMSEAALLVMEADLAEYPDAAVLAALTRCRRELDRPLTLKAILERLADSDGRPTGDEAFASAVQALDESETVVWTDEMQKAWAIAAPIYSSDRVGARVAFRDAYERLCRESRDARRPAQWHVSQGWDVEKRRVAVDAAVRSGYLTQQAATALLPAPEDEGIVGRLLLGKPTAEDLSSKSEVALRCRGLIATLKGRLKGAVA